MTNFITNPEKNLGAIGLLNLSRFGFPRCDFRCHQLTNLLTYLLTDWHVDFFEAVMLSENRPRPGQKLCLWFSFIFESKIACRELYDCVILRLFTTTMSCTSMGPFQYLESVQKHENGALIHPTYRPTQEYARSKRLWFLHFSSRYNHMATFFTCFFKNFTFFVQKRGPRTGWYQSLMHD